MRLGVALLLPSPVAEEVDGLRRAVGDKSLGRAPAHVTLVPPVNVGEADLGRVLAVLRTAAAAAPTEMNLGLGPPTTFLPANPVLYLPVAGDGLDALVALRRRVMVPPLARPPAWPFVPHVTLADMTDAGAEPDVATDRISRAVEVLAGYRGGVRIDRVHLLRETRSAPGQPAGRSRPRWQPLADVAFGPPAVVSRGGPLAVELVRSQMLCPEGEGLLAAEGFDAGWVHDDCARRPTLVVTARREQAVVGVAGAWLGPDGGRSGVVVAAAHRHQGIGRHLVAATEAAVVDAAWGCSELRPVRAEDYTKRMAE